MHLSPYAYGSRFNSSTVALSTDWRRQWKRSWLAADDQERLEGVFAALLTDLIAAAFAKATEQGRPLDPVLQCVLDEAPYVARLPNLARVASTGAGEGIRLLTAAQTMSQLVERWGQAEAETILAGHPSRIFGSGLSDPTSLSYLRTALGEEEIQTLSYRGGLGHVDRTHATTFRPLVDGPTARESDRSTAILVYGHLPPARLRLRPWFQDRRLQKLVEGPGVVRPIVSDEAEDGGAGAA